MNEKEIKYILRGEDATISIDMFGYIYDSLYVFQADELEITYSGDEIPRSASICIRYNDFEFSNDDFPIYDSEIKFHRNPIHVDGIGLVKVCGFYDGCNRVMIINDKGEKFNMEWIEDDETDWELDYSKNLDEVLKRYHVIVD